MPRPPRSPASRANSLASSSHGSSVSSSRKMRDAMRKSQNYSYWRKQVDDGLVVLRADEEPPPEEPLNVQEEEKKRDKMMRQQEQEQEHQQVDIVLSHDFCDRFSASTKQRTHRDLQYAAELGLQREEDGDGSYEEELDDDDGEENLRDISPQPRLEKNTKSSGASTCTTKAPTPRPLPPFRAISISSERWQNPRFPPTAHDMVKEKGRSRRSIACRRAVVLCAIGVALTMISLFIFYASHERQHDAFVRKFRIQATKTLDLVSDRVEQKLAALDSFSVGITSHVISTASTFPNVTIDDFDVKASASRVLSDGWITLYHPIVTDEQREGWEAYSVLNHGHLARAAEREKELLARQDEKYHSSNERGKATSASLVVEEEKPKEDRGIGRTLRGDRAMQRIPDFSDPVAVNETAKNTTSALEATQPPPAMTTGFWPKIWGLEDGGVGEPTDSGPYAPLWGISPAVNLPSLLNFNMLRMEMFRLTYNQVMKKAMACFGAIGSFKEPDEEYKMIRFVFNEVVKLSQFRYEHAAFEDEPISTLGYPVFDSFGSDRKVAGILSTVISWRLYFSDLLPESAVGLVVVLHNSLGESETYRIDGGTAIYEGDGDRHDAKYDDYVYTRNIQEYISDRAGPATRSFTAVDLDDILQYILAVYPSDRMESELVTVQPVLLAVVVAVVFLLTSIIFICYDSVVVRRQRMRLNRDIFTIASGLFPTSIQNRFMQSHPELNSPKPLHGILKRANSIGSRISRSHSRRKVGSDASIPKNVSTSAMVNDYAPHVDSLFQPIAEEFPDTTICCINLVNLTQWSRTRQPDEVFQALDTIYGMFDSIATSRGVLKLDCSGESYVAACLSEPQETHAVIMSQFACECIVKFKSALSYLHYTLEPYGYHEGDDQNEHSLLDDIALRVGLHSGSVTGGVLRGDRGRFQLLPGDTVQIASRMAQTGSAHRIQCSEATAERLVLLNKERWLIPRSTRIKVPGTPSGDVQSYWIGRHQSEGSNINGGGGGDDQ